MEKDLENIITKTILERKLNESPNRAQYAAKLTEALKKYNEAASRLSILWDDAQDQISDDEWALETDLPFDKSFDEHAGAIDEWVDKSVKKLRKIK